MKLIAGLVALAQIPDACLLAITVQVDTTVALSEPPVASAEGSRTPNSPPAIAPRSTPKE